MQENYEHVQTGRILVPMAQRKEIIDNLLSWLEQACHLWNTEIVLLHIADPLWMEKIPYTAFQAERLLKEQAEIEKELQYEFNAIAEKVRRRISRLNIRAIVKTSHTPAESIVDYANHISADYIVMMTRKRNGFEKLFESRLVNQITNMSERDVQVIKNPIKKKRHHLFVTEGTFSQSN